MSIIDVKNLNFIRQIPLIGARIYEAFSSLQQGVSAMAVQANLNPTGQVDPPPTIQAVKAVGQNGVLHVSIEHTAADVKRGVLSDLFAINEFSVVDSRHVVVGFLRIRNDGVPAAPYELSANLQSRHPKASFPAKADAFYPGGVSGLYLHVGGILRRGAGSQVTPSIVQSVVVLVIYLKAARVAHDESVHVDGSRTLPPSVCRHRVKRFSAYIPPCAPFVLRHQFVICAINDGALPLREGDGAVFLCGGLGILLDQVHVNRAPTRFVTQPTFYHFRPSAGAPQWQC